MTVNVLLTTGKWFQVADGAKALSSDSGSLEVYGDPYEVTRPSWSRNGGVVSIRTSAVIRTFGPGSWVTWDVEGER